MSKVLSLFEGYGVELEYMIVDKDTLKVKPVCDEVIKEITGEYVSDIELGSIAVSNELVLHVIEFKTNGPAASLSGLDKDFMERIGKINGLLGKFNAMLLPTGAHPFMDPFTESRLWPHEYNPVYESYNRIFDCRGHGWSNLQSTHINLPFNGDEEFGRLHGAIRIALPLIPAIAASTPVISGELTGFLDTRLEYYRKNQVKVPEIAGSIIPEPVKSRLEYENLIHKKIYAAIKPYDTENILQHEWLNSRGAIARFDRMAIEIRLIDIQEAPIADLALVNFIAEFLKYSISERLYDTPQDEKDLLKILTGTTKEAGNYVVSDEKYAALFGLQPGVTASEILSVAYNRIEDKLIPGYKPVIKAILEKGTLSERMILRMGASPSKETIEQVYRELAACLKNNRMFEA